MKSGPRFESEPRFVKYREIKHLMEIPEILDGNNLEIYEKLDGGNSQVRVYNGRILTGSRANFLKREELFEFDWFKVFNKWAKSNHSFYNLPENWIAYGEFLSPHTIIYKPEFINRFFLIDVYNLCNKRFIPYLKARDELKKLGIENVLFLEPLKKGKFGLEEIKSLAIGKSLYSGDKREGVVIKDYHNQRFAKLWRTSVNPTKEGLIEEIKKTIMSLEMTAGRKYFPLLERHPERKGTKRKKHSRPQENIPSGTFFGVPSADCLSLMVYDELSRTGRKILDIPLAEINKAIERIVNKI